MPSTRPAGQPELASPGTQPSGPYWDAVYQRRCASGVSWFQAEPQTSVDLIRAHATPHTPIIGAGASAGSLTGQLAAAGFTDLTAIDISAAALQAARHRLAGHPAASRIRSIHADLLSWQPDRRYGLWHDRAVFHFLTEPAGRTAYLATLRTALQPGGTVILATFAPGRPHPLLRAARRPLLSHRPGEGTRPRLQHHRHNERAAHHAGRDHPALHLDHRHTHRLELRLRDTRAPATPAHRSGRANFPGARA